jgi:putative flippase GtrA
MEKATAKDWKQMARDGAKFYSVGIAGIGVQLATLTGLVGFLKLNYLLATAIAVETAVLHNFVWHERWTWKHRSLSRDTLFQRLFRFNITAGTFSIVGNVVLMRVFVGIAHFHFFISNLLSIGSCSALNFLISHRFIFRNADQGKIKDSVSA